MLFIISSAVPVGRNVQITGSVKSIILIQSFREEIKRYRFTNLAAFEYGKGNAMGENTYKLFSSLLIPIIPLRQLRNLAQTLGISFMAGKRTPVFSINKTLLPCAANVRIIS